MILVNPSYNREKKLGGFSKYVPVSVPFGIGYLASNLIVRDKKVKILAEEITSISEKVLDEYVQGLDKPYIFGLSCLTAGIVRGYELADVIKRMYPDSKVIFGNMHPTVLPEEVLSHESIDIVVRGEGEEILNTLYERIKNRRDYSDIKGISFKRDGTIMHNEAADLPDLAKVSRFPYYLFAEYSNKYELGFISSSRGCPFDCIFCSQRCISGRQYRYFPSEIIIQDVEELIFNFNRSYITFVDDSFLVNRKRVMLLCDLIRQKGFHKKAAFDCQARGDMVDEEILQNLKDAGFRTIHFGIETASERLMKLINKKETVEEVVKGVKLAKKFGFQVSGTFILGLPTETKEEREQAYRLTRELSLDYVRFNNATPYPGTKLYEIAIKEKRLNPGRGWENLNACGTLVGSPFKEIPLAYVPLTTNERELKHDILKYNLFYSFRPASILKILKEKVGPAGWLTLPKRWYLNIKDWFYLTRFSFRILFSFLKIFFYQIRQL